MRTEKLQMAAVVLALFGLVAGAQAGYLFDQGPASPGTYYNGIASGGEFTVGDNGLRVTGLGTYDTNGDGLTAAANVRLGYLSGGNQRTVANVDFPTGTPGTLVNIDGQAMYTRFQAPDTPGGVRLTAGTTWRLFGQASPLGTGGHSTSADIASYNSMYSTGGMGGWGLGSTVYYGGNAEYDIDNTRVAFDKHTYAAGWRNQNFTFGNKFTVGDNPLKITELGAFDKDCDGFLGTPQVGLWDSNNTLLASVTLASGKSGILTPVQSFLGGWRSVELADSVILNAGETYTVGALLLDDNGTDHTLYGVTLEASDDYHTVEGVYNTAGTLAIPWQAAGNPEASATFGYEVVPEPATLGLLAAGAIGLLARRKRQ